MSSILALDPGFGNTKVCLDGELSVMPSIIVQPKHLGRAGLGIKSAKNITEVFLEGHHFTVGAGAVEWGNPLSNLDYSALASLERQALFYAALSSLIQPGAHAVDLLVIGLPVPLLQDEHLSTLVLSDLKGYKGLHSFTVGKDEFSLDIQKLKVLPQPLGAYADWLLDDDLRPRANAAQAEAAILDIGMNTVDLYAVRGGRVEPRFVAGGKVGVRKLLERLDGGGRDLEELDSDLRQGRLALPSGYAAKLVRRNHGHHRTDHAQALALHGGHPCGRRRAPPWGFAASQSSQPGSSHLLAGRSDWLQCPRPVEVERVWRASLRNRTAQWSCSSISRSSPVAMTPSFNCCAPLRAALWRAWFEKPCERASGRLPLRIRPKRRRSLSCRISGLTFSACYMECIGNIVTS